jgi:beta-phosphoglucomutase-like phosphatase (HAD superfamily)
MRVSIKTDEWILIELALKELRDNFLLDDTENKLKIEKLLKKLKKEMYKPASIAKQNAAKKATKIRQERVKEKIQNAVNLLNLQGRKINVNSVSKEAGISYNTAKKYDFLIKSFNER